MLDEPRAPSFSNSVVPYYPLGPDKWPYSGPAIEKFFVLGAQGLRADCTTVFFGREHIAVKMDTMTSLLSWALCRGRYPSRLSLGDSQFLMRKIVAVSSSERIRRQQLLRQAEGYLELILSGESKFALDKELRDQLAMRCLECLVECELNVEEKGHLYYLRGEALRLMEEYPRAVEWLNMSLQFDADNVHIYLALGWCHKRAGDLDEAIESLEQGLDVDYTLAILHYNLACYLALAGRAKEAVGYLATSFEIDSSYRDFVPDESDFDGIRMHPDFLALTTVIV